MPTTNDEKPTLLQGADRIIQEVKDRFKIVADAESELRRLQLEDKRFAAGEQWPEDLKRQREAEKKPCLTIDRLTPQIKQVTNQQRQMRPSIQVHPVSGGDVETAEVYQGICKAIETLSDADDAYDQAGNDQAVMGRGYIGIETDYVDGESLNQEIRIVRKRRPESIYFDIGAEKRDYSDALYALECFDLPKETYKARFPQSRLAVQGLSLEELRTLGDDAPNWVTEETIRVVKYWHVEISYEKSGRGTKERQIERRTVLCDVVNAVEVLEHYDWPGKYIPLVPVIGEEIVLDGKVDYRGMVRRAKDPQRMTNYWKTAATEMVALAKTAPWLIAEGQIEGYENLWDQANTKNLPYLPYRATNLAGNMVPPPQRIAVEPPIQAISMMTQASENDLRAATGFYDVGERETREQSGRAIMARQKQGELGNSDFLDGLARAIRHVGRIIIDLAPHIYDVPRVMRILGTDGKPKEVLVHAGNPEAAQQELATLQASAQKVSRAFDIGAGTYDVTVTAAPNQGTARQEFTEQLGQIFQGNPQLFQIIGDLYFENLDIANAQQIAKRLKKVLPPQLQDDGDEDVPPAAQAKLAQQGQQIEQMGMMLQEAQKAVEGKQLELQAKAQIAAEEIRSKEQIAAAELQLKAQIAQLQEETARAKAILEAQIAQMKLQAEQQKVALQAELAQRSQQAEHRHAAGMAAQSAGESAIERREASEV